MKPTIKGGLCQRLLREHMFASLCRNRSSRTLLLLLLLPTLFLYVAWSSSRFRRRGESSFTMCIFTHETRTNQLDIKWDAAITAIQHLGIFIDFDWCSNAWWWKEKVLVYRLMISKAEWWKNDVGFSCWSNISIWSQWDQICKNCILVHKVIKYIPPLIAASTFVHWDSLFLFGCSEKIYNHFCLKRQGGIQKTCHMSTSTSKLLSRVVFWVEKISSALEELLTARAQNGNYCFLLADLSVSKFVPNWPHRLQNFQVIWFLSIYSKKTFPY